MDSTGFFIKETGEYTITDMYPVRKLKNYLWNEDCLSYVDQFGCGKNVAAVGSLRREFSGEERYLYIKEEDGYFYSPTRNFRKDKFEEFKSVAGIGYQKITSRYHGILTEFTYLVPKTGRAEMIEAKITNESLETRNLGVYMYSGFFVNIVDHISYSRSSFSKGFNAIVFSHDGFDLPHEYTSVVFATDGEADSYECTKEGFLGVYNEFSNPDALHRERLKNTCGASDYEYGGAFMFKVKLNAGETRKLYFAAITTRKGEESKVSDYIGEKRFLQELEYYKNRRETFLKTTRIKSPDDYINVMTNVWLKRQVELGKTWGRGAGKGFRDVMQDITAFVSLDNELARARILSTLAHQYVNGNAIRMFEPDYTHPYMDMPAWIPATILTYLKETNDFKILQEQIVYLDSDIEESVLVHTIKGVEFLLQSLGRRGLVLWGGGDWNDSLNNCGMKGLGESVWLSIATVKAVNELIELLEKIEYDKTFIRKLESEKAALVENIFKHGYKNGYFIYGYNDNGEEVGGPLSKEGKIYLNPQTWAVLSGLVKGKDAERILDFVEKELACEYGYVQCKPSYTKGDHDIGRATYFCPGIYENGSVYIHGVAFKMVADCIAGRGNAALNTINKIRYDNPANSKSGVEPYAVSNMYFGPESPVRKGYALFSWITGSAGWLYRCVTEYIFGIKAEYDRLRISPCLPDEWDNVSAMRVFNGSVYNIVYKKGNKKQIVYDGEVINDEILPVSEKNKVHDVTVYVAREG